MSSPSANSNASANGKIAAAASADDDADDDDDDDYDHSHDPRDRPPMTFNYNIGTNITKLPPLLVYKIIVLLGSSDPIILTRLSSTVCSFLAEVLLSAIY